MAYMKHVINAICIAYYQFFTIHNLIITSAACAENTNRFSVIRVGNSPPHSQLCELGNE